MKKLINIVVAVSSALLIITLVNKPLAAQNSKGGSDALPDDVMRIVNKTCVHCHAEPGSFMAISHFNLSKWNEYSMKKQANKAQAMCSKVTKGKMPPKKFRNDHVSDIPTKNEINTICEWSQSLRVPK